MEEHRNKTSFWTCLTVILVVKMYNFIFNFSYGFFRWLQKRWTEFILRQSGPPCVLWCHSLLHNLILHSNHHSFYHPHIRNSGKRGKISIYINLSFGNIVIKGIYLTAVLILVWHSYSFSEIYLQIIIFVLYIVIFNLCIINYFVMTCAQKDLSLSLWLAILSNM